MSYSRLREILDIRTKEKAECAHLAASFESRARAAENEARVSLSWRAGVVFQISKCFIYLLYFHFLVVA